MTQERRADTLTLILVVGFAVAVGLAYWQAFYLGKGAPYGTFLFKPDDKFVPGAQSLGVHFFGDFFGVWKHSKDASPYLNPSIFYASNYFPFTHLLLKPLTWFSYPVAAAIFLGGSWVALGAIAWSRVPRGVDRVRRALWAFALVALTYPVLFAIDRGNVELLMFLLMWLSLLCMERARWLLAAVPLAMAAAMKGTPLILAGIFLAKRQWGAAALSVGLTLLLTFVGFLIMDGSLKDNFDGLRDALKVFADTTEGGVAGLEHSTTIRGLLEVAGHEGWLPSSLADAWQVFAGVALIGFSAAAVLLPLALWERVAILVVAMILVPPTSFDYRLIHLLLAVFLLLRATRPPATAVVVMLGLALIPKGLPILYAGVDIGTVVNPLLLLGVGATLSATGFKRRREARTAATRPVAVPA